MTEREAYIALNLMEGMGPIKARSLQEYLGSLSAIFEADELSLQGAAGVGKQLAANIVRLRDRLDPADEEKRARHINAEIFTPVDDGYPDPLKNIHDPPLALYCKGTWDQHDRHAIALVGSRRSTTYGTGVADRLAYQLVKAGFTVVSGLARGIDTAAHRGALKAKGRTLAVVGSGMNRLYPPENMTLAQEISDQGAVLSEYPLEREPDRTTFPYRNRLVSGLGMGVVVVEAGFKSGALQTADMALEQGRSVFAVPGRVDGPSSRGCHQLLKNGARLVETVDDILHEFEFLLPPEKKEVIANVSRKRPIKLGGDEEIIVKSLYEGSMDVDTLVRKANLQPSRISSLLIGLEIKRVIRMLPGRMVELTVPVPEED